MAPSCRSAVGGDTLGTLLTWVYDDENRCINEPRPSGANHTYSYLENGLRWSYQMGGSANVYSLIWDGDDLLNEYVNGGASPSTRYAVLDGEILSRRASGTRYVLVPDPLGSVNHRLDTSLNKAATLAYWPYGEVQTDTGAGSPLRFIGALGYYTATANRAYVRARDLRPDLGRWQTEDPIGFGGGDRDPYLYAQAAPVRVVDPSGMLGSEPGQRESGRPAVGPACCGPVGDKVGDWVDGICKRIASPPKGFVQAVAECVRTSIRIGDQCNEYTRGDGLSKMLRCMQQFCAGQGDVDCEQTGECRPSGNWCGYAVGKEPHPPRPRCRIVMCLPAVGGGRCAELRDPRIPGIPKTLLHEMAHCCGVGHGWDEGGRENELRGYQCNDVVACCVAAALWQLGNHRCSRNS